ncbi:hypothetical protein JTE90_021307 [Oedothorax gibbosus]|uniref:C-type lectin domain-containing protein n=1 Tax=Oedothorax gibbosus TaxID=931172 RepID=A0AAV6VL96_9ARAC|nr:hypothetical protein JTE90_021307 [Oedothorax gibbosus]
MQKVKSKFGTVALVKPKNRHPGYNGIDIAFTPIHFTSQSGNTNCLSLSRKISLQHHSLNPCSDASLLSDYGKSETTSTDTRPASTGTNTCSVIQSTCIKWYRRVLPGVVLLRWKTFPSARQMCASEGSDHPLCMWQTNDLGDPL